MDLASGPKRPKIVELLTGAGKEESEVVATENGPAAMGPGSESAALSVGDGKESDSRVAGQDGAGGTGDGSGEHAPAFSTNQEKSAEGSDESGNGEVECGEKSSIVDTESELLDTLLVQMNALEAQSQRMVFPR